jgi:circadian clock protein KaiB
MSAAYAFRLYISGDAPNSEHARNNLTAIAGKHLDGQYTVEEVDVLIYPARALSDRIMITPTLVRLNPRPERRIIGNLSDHEKVVIALGL